MHRLTAARDRVRPSDLSRLNPLAIIRRARDGQLLLVMLAQDLIHLVHRELGEFNDLGLRTDL